MIHQLMSCAVNVQKRGNFVKSKNQQTTTASDINNYSALAGPTK